MDVQLLQDRLEEVICEALGEEWETHVDVTAFTLVVASTTLEGEKYMSYVSKPNQGTHETVGLLEYAKVSALKDAIHDDEG